MLRPTTSSSPAVASYGGALPINLGLEFTESEVWIRRSSGDGDKVVGGGTREGVGGGG